MDLRREEIGSVQIESVSALVLVVTKQKQNEVFVSYGGKKRCIFLAVPDVRPLGVSETEPTLRAAIPRNRRLGRGQC